MSPDVFCRLLRVAVIFPFLTLVTNIQARCESDFLVIENTDRLLVYNKYQQEARDKERALLAAFVPMIILKADDLLGDGFTRCMRVEISGETFFLLKDKDGTLTRSGPLGYERAFKGANSILDTIQVLSKRSVRLTPIASQAHDLSIGEKIFRIFRHRNGVYCQILGTPSFYGWVDFAGTKENRDWKIVRAERPTRATIQAGLSHRVQARVEHVNRLLKRLFDHFNAETHQQKRVPHWDVDASGESITCTLTGSSRNEDFEQSTVYLAREIENIIMGTDFRVSHAPGRIDIR